MTKPAGAGRRAGCVFGLTLVVGVVAPFGRRDWALPSSQVIGLLDTIGRAGLPPAADPLAVLDEPDDFVAAD
jgi:hypothetical protein